MRNTERAESQRARSFLRGVEGAKHECLSLGESLAELKLRAPSSGAAFQVEAAERHLISTFRELERVAVAVEDDRAKQRGETLERDEAQSLVRWFKWDKYPERSQRFSDVMKFFSEKSSNEPVGIETLAKAFKWFPGDEEQLVTKTRSVLDKIAEVHMLQREVDVHRVPSYSLSEKAARFLEKGLFREAFGVGSAQAPESATS